MRHEWLERGRCDHEHHAIRGEHDHDECTVRPLIVIHAVPLSRAASSRRRKRRRRGEGHAPHSSFDDHEGREVEEAGPDPQVVPVDAFTKLRFGSRAA